MLVFYFLHGKSELKVRWLHINEISECTRHARDIISLGSAGFIMQLTNSLVSICCNNVLSVTGGDIYISVMTIISSVRQMVETPIHAINEGTSPVLSYNYGARRPEKVKKAGDFFSLLRKVFIVVPLTYFLPYGLHMGTDGVFMTEPVSNVIGGSLCFITMLVTILPELNKMETTYFPE